MEEALAGIYRGGIDKEAETFRSYFSRGGDNSRDEAPFDDDADTAVMYGGTGDYEEYTSPETLQARYGARTVSAKNGEAEAAPKVVKTALPAATAAAAVEEAPEEEEDMLSDVLGDDPLVDPAGEGDSLDDDLRSLFEEAEEFHSVPDAVRKAIPDVTIEDLVAEARQIWGMIGSNAGEAAA